jgi:hypothetical protein
MRFHAKADQHSNGEPSQIDDDVSGYGRLWRKERAKGRTVSRGQK